MQNWKFLLLGITGDLSKRKILPGLAQFADHYSKDVTISLTGYSRSVPDDAEIQGILDKNTLDGKHKLQNVSYIQGEYNDPRFFTDMLSSLKPGERLVVYFAVPPVVFIELLKIFCPYNAKNLDILIEKPFGNNIEEAEKILMILEACGLIENVHFVDHYIFKSSSILNEEVKEKLIAVKEKKIKHITIQALESLDIQDRKGYYEGVGSFKDMFPAHLMSMLDLSVKTYKQDIDPKIYESFSVDSVVMGQYASYRNDVESQTSTTDTYFKVDGSFEIFPGERISVCFESGKKLGLKKTQITIQFEDGDILTWNIEPDKKIHLSGGSGFEYDLSSNKLDHTNVFERILIRNLWRFLSVEYVLLGWKIYGKVISFVQADHTPVKIYRDEVWPVQFIE